jgi:hypothetical protein
MVRIAKAICDSGTYQYDTVSMDLLQIMRGSSWWIAAPSSANESAIC